jgi:hypothetical protein
MRIKIWNVGDRAVYRSPDTGLLHGKIVAIHATGHVEFVSDYGEEYCIRLGDLETEKNPPYWVRKRPN